LSIGCDHFIRQDRTAAWDRESYPCFFLVFRKNGEICVQILDDGAGFDTEKLKDADGIAIRNLKLRLKEFLNADSSLDRIQAQISLLIHRNFCGMTNGLVVIRIIGPANRIDIFCFYMKCRRFYRSVCGN